MSSPDAPSLSAPRRQPPCILIRPGEHSARLRLRGRICAERGASARVVGNVFFAFMLAMSAVAAVSGRFSMPGQASPTSFGGIFTFYLVATGLDNGHPKGRKHRPSSKSVALFVPLGMAALCSSLSCSALRGLSGPRPWQTRRLGASTYFLPFAALAAARGTQGDPESRHFRCTRIASHLWRMSSALLFGSGSFSPIGLSRKSCPHSIHGSPFFLRRCLRLWYLLVFWLAARAG